MAMVFASKLNLCNIFWPFFTSPLSGKVTHLFETALVLCVPASLKVIGVAIICFS